MKNRCENLYNRVDVIHRSTKTEELHLKEQDLREIVTKTQQTFDSELHSYTVHLSLPEKPVDILADPEYMQQALHNLIRNALDAMEELLSEKSDDLSALHGAVGGFGDTGYRHRNCPAELIPDFHPLLLLAAFCPSLGNRTVADL